MKSKFNVNFPNSTRFVCIAFAFFISTCAPNSYGDERSIDKDLDQSNKQAEKSETPVKRKYIARVKPRKTDSLIYDPPPMSDYFVFDRVYVNDIMLGLKLIIRSRFELFEKYGVYTGDIFTAINNIELNSERRVRRAQDEIRNGGFIDVAILRDGAEIKLLFEIE